MKSDLSKEEKKARKELFGKFSEGFRKLKPYFFRLDDGRKILEIPVTTMPLLKLPFHLSYLIYINNISAVLMRSYLSLALFLCRITRTPISFLLHPLDIIGGDQITQLAFFPGMNVRSEEKIEVFKYVVRRLMKHFGIISVEHYSKTYQYENPVT